MTEPASIADLEIRLRRAADAAALVDVSVRHPSGQVDTQLVTDAPVQFDLDALHAMLLDPSAYGRTLAAQLFADARLHDAWNIVRGYMAAGSGLRVRLRLDAALDALHSLRWETLREPAADTALAHNQRLLLSRYLDSADLTYIDTSDRSQLRAVVAVANPAGLERYQLAPVDSVGEVARARAALDGMDIRILADGEDRRASLANLGDALRDGCDILYLVCHGTLKGGEPYLWLETDDGQLGRVAGADLVQQIQNLPVRPLLVVLASCQSMGASHERGAPAALGPQLARAGVAAVLAMQDNIPMD
ncbi:MAG TPA: CHAT domain-containing protein, partial [Roseiflexaceae bacterium]|nr:CHAT domain-containing protein [Roseiflexaceae bacterium]